MDYTIDEMIEHVEMIEKKRKLSKLLLGGAVLLTLLLTACGPQPDCDTPKTFSLHEHTYYGHAFRGSNTELMENSMEALEWLLTEEVEKTKSLEFDINATADGTPVVIHDDDTCGVSKQLVEISRTYIWDLPPMFNGEEIPTMTEVTDYILENYRGSAGILVDMKKANTAATPEIVANANKLFRKFPKVSMNLHRSNRDNVNINLICKLKDRNMLFRDQDTRKSLCDDGL